MCNFHNNEIRDFGITKRGISISLGSQGSRLVDVTFGVMWEEHSVSADEAWMFERA